MADNRTKEAAAASSSDASEPRAAAPVAAPGDDKFAVADLIVRSYDFLGEPSYVTAGALHGVTDPLTIDDAKSRIAAWLQSPAEEG